MVYLGPSRGCETCKRRRKKSCLRCRNSNRTCGGYDEQASKTLIFRRNHTQTPNPTRTDWATVEPLARKCSLPIRAPYPGTDILPDDAVPKEVSEDGVVAYAVRAFFYDFSISALDSTSVGFLKDLAAKIQQTGLDSVLAKACTMIGYANHARKLRRPSFTTKAEVLYHELLRFLAKEIATVSGEDRSDLIQLAWLMGLYEVVVADETRLEQIDVHVRGIVGMLQVENSPLGFVRGAFSACSLFPSAPSLPHSVNDLGRLQDILFDIGPLRMEAELVLADLALTESHLVALRQRVSILNNRLAKWEESVAPESKPVTIGHIPAGNSSYIEVGYWPGPLHMYIDLRAAAILNISRVARCYLLDLIFRLNDMQADGEDDGQEIDEAVQLIQDFTSSIPYHLVEDLHSFFAIVQRGHRIEEPGRAVGGLLLMYPLYIASRLSIVPLEMQDYFRRCLFWIGQNMGVGHASLLSNFGPHERRVKKYLEEATRGLFPRPRIPCLTELESILEDLRNALRSRWAGAKDVWSIFASHSFRDGYEAYWDVESFRQFLASRHPGIASHETTYLLWRCLHFYAHHPFPHSSRGSRIDEKGFQRAIALLAFRGTGLLGTQERGDYYWRDDEAAFQQADFRRIVRSLSELSIYYPAEHESTVTDVMDVLATTLPHSTALAPSPDQLRDAALRILPQPSTGYRLFRDGFSLFVRLLLQLRLWDVQGSCLPSGIFSDESDCQKLAESITEAISNEDQTIDPGIVTDVLPGVRERFYHFWGVIFQPQSLRDKIVPPEECLPNRTLAAVSLLLSVATRDASWPRQLLQTQDLGMDNLLEQIRGGRNPHIVLFTNETCTAVLGAYIPNPSSRDTESQCTSNSPLDDSGHFLFQLSPRFCLLRSIKSNSSLEELFRADSVSSLESTTMDEKPSRPYTVGHIGAGRGTRLRVDPQSLTVTMVVDLDESSEERAIYTDVCRRQNGQWELTVHPAQLHILRVRPSASTPTWSRNTNSEAVISGEELRNRIHGFGSTNSEIPKPGAQD
ncbi:putative C6 transcription factor [Aspergillus thermomutatus]|uniref:Zn(2)-C6 fungal-type domain-containing protein n=1 Tax=Aspergillus thermomutatus TaxID=41047 RepID=A0A397G8C8_ASPTH|nr:uncharacterized protein CDV56_103834 [Aspergillus thermomutatus]RHZ45586.1 hypothetical protein CDV56_103834 [Aspergillus thermomutatus]